MSSVSAAGWVGGRSEKRELTGNHALCYAQDSREEKIKYISAEN